MWYVGTSGWQYESWRGSFYPSGVAKRRWLEHYTSQFDTVEVNNTFYRLPPASVFESWANRTPDGFVLACKLSRYLSHIRRLREPAESVALFLDRAAPLGERLGPLLLQLPPTFKADPSLLAEVLAAVPARHRVAVELRHGSWFEDKVYAVLAERDAALVLADRRAKPVGPVERTASWAYVRFHEGRARPWPAYGDTALRVWIDRIRERWPDDADVYAYFNNDPNGCAPRDAVRFRSLVERQSSGGSISRRSMRNSPPVP